MIETVFLDAGGVLVFPNWVRIADALGQRGVNVTPSALAAAEPFAKKQIDTGQTIQATNDAQRGWTYFNLVLTAAGVPLSDATAEALSELHVYHQEHNLWEFVPPGVPGALAALRARRLKLVVVSNANGTLHRAFDRLGLTPLVDVLFDSFLEKVEKPDPRFFQIALDRVRRLSLLDHPRRRHLPRGRRRRPGRGHHARARRRGRPLSRRGLRAHPRAGRAPARLDRF